MKQKICFSIILFACFDLKGYAQSKNRNSTRGYPGYGSQIQCKEWIKPVVIK